MRDLFLLKGIHDLLVGHLFVLEQEFYPWEETWVHSVWVVAAVRFLVCHAPFLVPLVRASLALDVHLDLHEAVVWILDLLLVVVVNLYPVRNPGHLIEDKSMQSLSIGT